jgi:C4-type Zn-finger protein
MMHKCPICGGSITNVSVTKYEEGNEVRVVTEGICSRCGAPYKHVRVIKLRKHEFITW